MFRTKKPKTPVKPAHLDDTEETTLQDDETTLQAASKQDLIAQTGLFDDGAITAVKNSPDTQEGATYGQLFDDEVITTVREPPSDEAVAALGKSSDKEEVAVAKKPSQGEARVSGTTDAGAMTSPSLPLEASRAPMPTAGDKPALPDASATKSGAALSLWSNRARRILRDLRHRPRIGAVLAVGGCILVATGLAFTSLTDKVEGEHTPGGIATSTAPSPGVAIPPSDSLARKGAATLMDRAASGEAEAIQQLSSRSPEEREAAETLALAKGRRLSKLRELDLFGRKLREEPNLLKDRAQLRKLRGYINDREVAVEALWLVGELPGSLGPDLLYDVWVRDPYRTETTVLAEELVYSRQVKAKASPALNVVLDLRHAKTCDAVREILPRAKQEGDRRFVSSLNRILVRRGCGKKPTKNCFACLRTLESDKDAVTVRQAVLAARRRRPPVVR